MTFMAFIAQKLITCVPKMTYYVRVGR